MYTYYDIKNRTFKLFVKTIAVLLSVIITVGIVPSFSYANELEDEIVEETPELTMIDEIEELRDEYTKTFLMSDHTMQVVQYGQPIHYQEDDKWIEYDLSLKENEAVSVNDFDGYKAESSEFDVKFADSINADTLVSINKDNYSLNWTLSDGVSTFRSLLSDVEIASKSDTTVTDDFTVRNVKDSITYSDFRNNSDLNYQIDPEGIKENIIVNKKLDSYEYNFTLNSTNLDLIMDDEGNILCNDIDTGEQVFFIPHAYMYDAAFEYSVDVEYSLEKLDDKYILTISASDEWINSDERVFPVTIDPQVEINKNYGSLTICNVSSTKSTSDLIEDENLLLIGCPNISYGNCSALLKFDLPELSESSTIINSQLILQENGVVKRSPQSQETQNMQINAYTIETTWNKLTNSWTRPLYDPNVLDYAWVSTDDIKTIENGKTVPKVFDITKAVESWYNGNKNYGIMLESSNILDNLAASFFFSSQNGSDTQPVLIVNYRTNTGIEPYWTFTEMSNGDAGTAYVNNYNGNVIYSYTDVSTSGNKLPIEIKHIYNRSNLRNFHRIGPNVGENFKLNIQQTVRYASFYGLTGDDARNYPYIYEDGDGTSHYFYKKSTGEMIDEDGLGLELKIINDENGKFYTISDKTNNVLTFNDLGNLIKYEDCQKNPNTMNILYKRVVVNDIPYDVITEVTDGSGHKIVFNYKNQNDILLRSITDEEGIKTTYSYSMNNEYLKGISSSNGNQYTLSYTDISHSLEQVINEENDLYIYFQYSSILYGEKVKGLHLCKRNADFIDVLEKDIKGNGVLFKWYKNATVINSCGADGVFNTSDDVYNKYQFDETGRTISVNSYDKNNDYGAAIYDYTAASNSATVDDIKQRNKISSNASLGKNVYNLINNIGAEFDGGWKNSAVNTAEYRVFNDTHEKYEGQKSFKINCLSSANDGRARYYQDFSKDYFEPGETYTFSAYVKTSNLKQVSSEYQYSGAGLIVTSYDENNKGIENYQSEYILGTTNYGENGWTRLYTTFTVPENAALLRVNLVIRNAVGIAYFDNVQFEKSDTVSPVNLVENSNFKRISNSNSAIPDKWYPSKLDTDNVDGVRVTESVNEYNTFQIVGNTSVNKMLMSDVFVSPDENDTYIVSGWAMGNAVPGVATNKDSGFNISVKIHYSDGTSVEKHECKFNRYVSDWQYSAFAFSLSDGTSAKKTPTYVTLYLRYKKQVNDVEFKNIQLIKADANSYVYDSEGNAINTSNSAAQSLSNTYSGSDLTKSVDKNGYETKFEYDNYHNVIKSTTQNGIETDYTYNDSGQITKTLSSDGFLIVSKETEYNEADEELGIAAGAYVTKQYDENGKAVIYDYDLQSGKLNKVTNQKGVSTDFEYDEKGRLTSMKSADTTESYSYKRGNLSSLKRTGIDGTALDYSMTYSTFGYLTSTKVGSQLLSLSTYNEKNGNMLQTTYGNGDKFSYTYDNFGNVKTVKENDELVSSSVYNNRGMLMIDNDHKNALSTDYAYDTINRVKSKKVHKPNSPQTLFSTNYEYDINSQITKITNYIGGRRYHQSYEYGKDGLLTKYTFSNTKTIDYTYDELSRPWRKVFNIGASNNLLTEYNYKEADRFQPVMNIYTTNYLESETINNYKYSYDYDALGNITRISEKSKADKKAAEVVSYEYDDLSQLTRENNKNLSQTIVYEYDDGGNIQNKKIYPLTTGEITSEPIQIITYSYENKDWCDQLTSYNGQQITYDEIGNPTNYLGYTMDWTGRELNSLNGNDLDVSYSYDTSGTRISKTVNGTKYEYQYESGKLFYEKRDNAEFYYQYDGTGALSTIIHYDGNGNRAQYYVLCNSRGDIVDIYNQDGTLAAHYIYDSWGYTISILDNNGNEITNLNNIGILNQIRYRGYYFDAETGYYYLMSRYYNPELGRFLNADVFCSTGDSVAATNMYRYCMNNPVNSLDVGGLKTATETVATVITEIFVCWDLQEIAKELKINFSFTNFSDYIDMKVLLYTKAFDEGLPGLLPSVLDDSADVLGKLSSILGFMPFLPDKYTTPISISQYFFTIWNDNSHRYLSIKGALIMTAVDLFLNGISDSAASIISKFVNPIVGNLVGIVLGGFSDLLGTRKKAEYIAYNWYFL